MRRPKRLRTRLYLYYSCLFAAVLLVGAMFAQLAIARVAERAASVALKSGAVAVDRLAGHDAPLTARDIAMIENLAAIDLSAVVLTRRADDALYAAKQAGKNTWRHFDEMGLAA